MERTLTMTADTRTQFETLLAHHRGIVLKVAASYTAHPEDRAELAQEIATQLWRAYPSYDATRAFSTWMYRVALNVAISHLRGEAERRRRAVALDEERHDLADPNAVDPEAEGRLRTLRRFIGAQPPLERALLLLYLEERSYAEIAEIVGITETNVATKLNRLKQRMREQL